VETTKAKTRGLNKTTTQTVKYERYNLARNIQLWDTFGWTPDSSTYKGAEFDNMIKGKISSGQHMSSLSDTPTPDYQSEIDHVVFVIDRSAMAVQEDIAQMKRFADIAKNRGKSFSVAVTKMDIEDKQLNNITNHDMYLRHLENTTLFKEIRTMLWKSWGDDEIKVYPVVNYEHGSTSKNLCLEKTGSNLLDGILGLFDGEGHTEEESYDLFAGEHITLGSFIQ